jgi:hypothetical protein
MHIAGGFSALAAFGAVIGVGLYYRSFRVLPIALFLMLSTLNIPLTSVYIAPRFFNVTPLDISFLACVIALIGGSNERYTAQKKYGHVTWGVARYALWLIPILLGLDFIANLAYQSAGGSIHSLLSIFRTYCQGYVIPMYILTFFREEETKAARAALFALAVLALFDVVVSLHSGGQTAVARGVGGRATPFGQEMNAQAFAQILALCLVVAVAEPLRSPGVTRLGLLPRAAIAACAIGIVVTGSRESFLGAIAGVIWLVARSRRSGGSVRTIVQTALAGVVVFVALLLARGLTGQFTNVFQRFAGIVQTKTPMSDDNFKARYIADWNAVGKWVEHPEFILTGRSYSGGSGDFKQIVFDADSAYVDTVNSMGIFALIAIIVFLRRLWNVARRLGRTRPDLPVSTHVIEAAIIAYCVIGLAGNAFGSPLTTMAFLTIVCTEIVDAANRPSIIPSVKVQIQSEPQIPK